MACQNRLNMIAVFASHVLVHCVVYTVQYSCISFGCFLQWLCHAKTFIKSVHFNVNNSGDFLYQHTHHRVFGKSESFCGIVCVCVCVYVAYEDTNVYNDMGMTSVLQREGDEDISVSP